MKRTYSDMTLSLLPKISIGDPGHFKSTLDGCYTLTVTKVTDISKPLEKPVEEIEEPEEDELAQQNKLNKSNARMIQLHLVDSDQTEIMAIETEKIDKLTFIKLKSLVSLQGPIELRCRNLMLKNKHIVNIQEPPKQEPKLDQGQTSELRTNRDERRPETCQSPVAATSTSVKSEGSFVKMETQPAPQPVQVKPQSVDNHEIVIIDEDWDEDDEEDCIVLN